MTDREAIELSAYYRGKVLHIISDLEFIINTCISFHYCGKKNHDKAFEMQLAILGDDRISLNNKAQILHFILTKYHSDWLKTYVSLRPKEPKKQPYTLNSDLVWVIEQRNVFAHRILDRDMFFSKEKTLKEGVIRFARFKNEITPVEYGTEEFDLLYETIGNLSVKLNEIVKLNQ